METSYPQDPSPILALEDHPLFSEALQVLLASSGFCHVDHCSNPDEARRRIESFNYALCLLDLNLGGSVGTDIIAELRAMRPTMRILVVSMYHDVSLVDTVLRKGAHGYLCKDSPPDEYIPAIRHVLAGGEYLSGDLRPRLEKFRRSQPTAAADGGLSPREMTVLSLLGRGATVKAIASELNLSPKTVETHCASIKRKLGLRSMNELIRHAVRLDTF